MSIPIDRRSFMASLLAGVVAPAFLPGAGRLWRPETLWVPVTYYATIEYFNGNKRIEMCDRLIRLKDWQRALLPMPYEFVTDGILFPEGGIATETVYGYVTKEWPAAFRRPATRPFRSKQLAL